MFKQMESEYPGVGVPSQSVGSDIVETSLTVALIGDSEFAQHADLAEDPDHRWAQGPPYEIMNE